MSLFKGLFKDEYVYNIGNGTNNIISNNDTSITKINGTTYFNGINLNERLGIKNINSITRSNGKIIINGKDYTKELLSNEEVNTVTVEKYFGKKSARQDFCGDICIEIKGSCGDINTTGAVSVGGDVNGDIDTNGTVSVGGDVNGDIDTNGDVIIGRR